MENDFKLFEEKASKNTKTYIDMLDAKAKPLFKQMLELCYSNNINAQVSSSFRTFTEQNEKYQQGRTTPGNIISYAMAGQSLHNYRRACDLFISEGKKALYPEETFGKIWELCKQNNLDKSGMYWGGLFKKLKDTPHFEVSYGRSWREVAVECGVSVQDILAGNWQKYSYYL